MTAPEPVLTDPQQDQLALLIRFSALSRRGALTLARSPDLDELLMPALQELGLVVSTIGARPRGYWLTAAGQGRARRIRDQRNGMA